jgi:Histidine kinase-, DNA gyrase B-, and HSP90-like ATPase
VLRCLLEEVGGWQVVGEADSGEAAIPLVEQLLQASAFVANRSPVLRAEAVMAAEVVAEVVDDWRLAEPDRRVELHLPDRPRSLQGDAEALRMVVGNLVDNAGKHAPPGTPIHVAVDQPEGLTRIEVTDRSQGVAAVDRERIFAPSPSSTPPPPGAWVGSAWACSWPTGWSGAWAARSGWRTPRRRGPLRGRAARPGPGIGSPVPRREPPGPLARPNGMFFTKLPLVLAGLLLAGLLVAACADADEGGGSGQGAAPTTSPTLMTEPAPTTKPPASAGEVTVTGTVSEGVEPGCLLLDGYLLVGGDRSQLQPGTRVAVTGRVDRGLLSTCQQGEPLVVASIEAAP